MLLPYVVYLGAGHKDYAPFRRLFCSFLSFFFYFLGEPHGNKGPMTMDIWGVLMSTLGTR
jgi:hypothetical protein